MPQSITVQRINDIAPYSGPGALDGIRFRAVRTALGLTAFGCNVLDLDPHCENAPEHHHRTDNHEEVYVVLEGSVILRSGDDERTLHAGDLAFVPGECVRKLITREAGALVLALGGNPNGKYAPSMGG